MAGAAPCRSHLRSAEWLRPAPAVAKLRPAPPAPPRRELRVPSVPDQRYLRQVLLLRRRPTGCARRQMDRRRSPPATPATRRAQPTAAPAAPPTPSQRGPTAQYQWPARTRNGQPRSSETHERRRARPMGRPQAGSAAAPAKTRLPTRTRTLSAGQPATSLPLDDRAMAAARVQSPPTGCSHTQLDRRGYAAPARLADAQARAAARSGQ